MNDEGDEGAVWQCKDNDQKLIITVPQVQVLREDEKLCRYGPDASNATRNPNSSHSQTGGPHVNAAGSNRKALSPSIQHPIIRESVD